MQGGGDDPDTDDADATEKIGDENDHDEHESGAENDAGEESEEKNVDGAGSRGQYRVAKGAVTPGAVAFTSYAHLGGRSVGDPVVSGETGAAAGAAEGVGTECGPYCGVLRGFMPVRRGKEGQSGAS